MDYILGISSNNVVYPEVLIELGIYVHTYIIYYID